ncbi:MAG: N-carbamoylputrescine amidase [Acidimicrobiales bacterium mtb01]|nr:N-carbamoylputrescine amidase [Actinomycetota bacterium]TEX46442.1 MAG: N-carbamoylputrescine amidase [Acidimicrobiales bacterium mtb01]
MRRLVVAAVQMAMADDVAANVDTAERLVRDAASRGARLVLIPELFEGRYFCQDQLAEHFDRARPLDGHPTIALFSRLAAELGVVLPISFFERANAAAYNSVAMIDADGSVLGVYRKSHIPDGPGYSEKYFFNPGDTGFTVWDTKVGRIGVGICWDQWFPECARVLALRGAEVIVYPTAIGSEPLDPSWDSSRHWQRVMQGHAGANLVPVIAANRYGIEKGRQHTLTFYGTSFIADPTGEVVAEAGRDGEAVLTADFDLDAVAALRRGWGVFRDRRPELYGPLIRLDGSE